VNWRRAVKSAQELEYMRRAARIVEAMHASILQKIEPGLGKNERSIFGAAARLRGSRDALAQSSARLAGGGSCG